MQSNKEKILKAKLDVFDWNKNKKASLDLPPEVFLKPMNKKLLHSITLWSLAKKRKGTHKAKTKGEVSGGGIKPYRQKGTGNARRGSNRSPLLAGGGVIFPPRPRDYSYKISKKTKKEALKVALSYLYQSKQIFILNEMKLETGKTKDLLKKIKALKIKKGILLSSKENTLLKRASSNLKDFKFKDPSQLSVYDLLKFETLISDEKSFKVLGQIPLTQTLKTSKKLTTSVKKNKTPLKTKKNKT